VHRRSAGHDNSVFAQVRVAVAERDGRRLWLPGRRERALRSVGVGWGQGK
jgi:hypothetical protein